MASHLRRALVLVWAASASWTLAWVAVVVIQGVLPAAGVYLTKWVLDAAGTALGQGLDWENVSILLVPAGLIGALMLSQRVFDSVLTWVQTAQAEYVQDHIQKRVHDTAIRVDMRVYDLPAYYDLMTQAAGNASSKPLELLNNLGSLLRSGITVAGIALLLIPYGWWLPFALIVSTAPALVVVVYYNREFHQWWETTTADRRRAAYYNQLVTRDWAAPELRIFGLGPHFRDAYQGLRMRLRGEHLDHLRRRAIAHLAAGLSALLVMGGVMAWLVHRALIGAATLGDLGLFYQAFSQGQGLMRTLLGSVGRMYSSALFLENLFGFLDLTPTLTAPARPAPVPEQLEDGIRFENVTFRYPGADRPAIQNFSMTIPAGQTVALVGPNGVGKSTLIKLLCRFYDPEAGRITVDGTDIRQFDPEVLRRRIAILFQTPVRYQASAADNITCGDAERPADINDIQTAARLGLADTFLEALPDGYDTHLGRWFGNGTDLSGGQWQRVCLARAFYRDAPVIILDEPTSAMDAWAETQWLKRFGVLVKGRTGLVVTHRFTTAMHADVIYVMHGRQIVESGTHEELLAGDGRYATSWTEQVRTGWRQEAGDGANPDLIPDDGHAATPPAPPLRPH
jgi:ATP-binding cassette subfamily B protein